MYIYIYIYIQRKIYFPFLCVRSTPCANALIRTCNQNIGGFSISKRENCKL